MWATACAPSMSTLAPTRCAISMTSLTGTIVPSTFETWATATSRVLSLRRSRVGVEEELAVVIDGDDLQLRPGLGGELLPGHDVGVVLEVRDHDLVAGADVLRRPQLCATRLIASVVPRVKTTFSADGAPRKSATVARAPS